MPSRLKDLRLRFPYDDQDFREKYTPGHVSPSSLKYTGDESKGPRAANASLKNNHPVFIFPTLFVFDAWPRFPSFGVPAPP